MRSSGRLVMVAIDVTVLIGLGFVVVAVVELTTTLVDVTVT